MDIKLNPIESFNPHNPFFIDILKPLKDFISWLIEQLVALGGRIITFLTEKIAMPIVEGFKWLVSKVVDLIKGFWNSVLTFLKGIASPVDPEKIITAVPLILGLAGSGVLGIGALLTAMNIKVMASGIDIEPLAKLLDRFIRPELIISFTLGTILGLMLRIPVGYWARKYFRPFKPDPITLFGLYTRGYITRTILRSELAYVTGYPEKYIDGLIDIFEYNPSLFDLMRLADFVELGDKFISDSLKVIGIKEPYYSLVFKVIKRRPLREEIRTNISELIILYSNGLISLEFLTLSLDKMEIMPAEKELILTLAKNRRMREIIERKIYIYRTAFIKGLITEAEFKRRLEELRLDIEFINLEIERGLLHRKIEVPIPKIFKAFAVDLPIDITYTYSIS